jgi:DNA polymerase III delta prime subunit
MTTNLHPSELTDHLVYRLRSGATMWGATLLAFTLALGSLAIDETHSDRRAHWLRTGLLTGGVAAAALAFLARENVVQRSLISLDATDISAASRQQRYYEAMKPEAGTLTLELPTEPWNPNLFDWGRLVTEGDRFPHILLLGATGDGKTTLAEWLHRAMAGHKIAIHPHWQASDDPTDPADFDYADQVIGGGRNFPAISAQVELLHRAMTDRANMTRSQLRNQPLLSVAIDELPAIGKNCSEATLEQIISLLFEARKFRIRLMLLAQADSVKILGLEGQGAVRENLTYIRLGDYALDHAKWLINKKLAPPDLLDWLQTQPRPCMVEDSPAIIPTLKKGGDNRPFLAANPVVEGLSWLSEPARFSQNPERSQVQPEPLDREPVNLIPLEGSGISEPLNVPDPLTPEISSDEWQRVVNLRQGGGTQDDIIEEVWGVKKGGSAAYKAAREKYRAILKSARLE